MRLYKKDSKDKIRVLDITANNGVLSQSSGIIDGKMVIHTKQCYPKNVGKTNETTSIEQAVLERDALISKKLKEGYFKTEEEANNEVVIMPMLAKSYFDEEHKIKDVDSLCVQAKLDGIRAITFYNASSKEIKMMSRSNRELETVQHLKDSLLTHLTKFSPDTDIILDGELYIHGNTFQENVTLVKNTPTKEDEKIFYHIYDIVSDTDFLNRNITLKELFSENVKYINLVETYVTTKNSLELYFTHAIDAGYEGIMVRIPNSKYTTNKRSSDLLKYKKFKDIALPIVDITPNDANPNHGTVWVEYNGQRTKTGAKLSHKEREDLLINKDSLIGKTAEIRYFEETDDGLLRFPVYLGERIDK